MHRFAHFTGAVAAIVLAAPAVPTAWAADEAKAGVEAFKAEIKAIKTWVETQEKGLKENPMGGIALMKELVTKVQAVKTDKLPSDLKEAFTGFSTVLGEMGATIFKDAPEKAEEMLPFMMKLAQDPDFQTKMEKLGKAGDAASAKLKEVAKKYGIDDLDLKPGGEKEDASGEAPAPAPIEDSRLRLRSRP